jgi:hypothetical protein
MKKNIELPNESDTYYYIQVTDNKTKIKQYLALVNDSIVAYPQVGADTLAFDKHDKARFFINKNLKDTNAQVITSQEYLASLDLTKYDNVDSGDLYAICLNENNRKFYVHYSLTTKEYTTNESIIGACAFTDIQADEFIKMTKNFTGVALEKELIPKKLELKPK